MTTTDISNATPLYERTMLIVGHPFTVLIDRGSGEVVAGGFCPVSELVARLEPADRGERVAAPHDHPVLAALRAYDAGDFAAIDALAVRQTAPPFRRVVQEQMRNIPAGTALTYGELAAESGRPTAARAAGSACATNLVALIVPCHRVVRTDGSHGGYAYGVEVKGALLRHEGVRETRERHTSAT